MMSPGSAADRVMDEERGELMHSTPVRWLAARLHVLRSDRGDVPGWVLVTLMTAGLVIALWAVAGDRLTHDLHRLDGLGRRRSVSRGSAAVDFVLVSALLTLLFVGVLQLALSLHVRNTLVDAAGEGARYGALVGRDGDDARARTELLIASALSDRLADDVTATTEDLDGVQTVVVTVRAPLPVLGLVGPRALELTGHAVDEKGLP